MRHAMLIADLEQNRLVVLSAVVALCCLFSPLIGIFLIYPIYNLGLGEKKLDSVTSARLRALYKIPWLVRLRRSRLDDCYLVGALGFSVLMVSPDVLSGPESDRVRNKIYHELGHHGRADYMACLSVTTGVVFIAFVIATVLLLHWTGVLTLDRPAQAHAILAALALIGGLCCARMRRNFHNREYLADTFAIDADPAAYRRYLERLMRSEPYRHPPMRIAKPLTRITHPSDTARLRFQNDPASALDVPTVTSLALNLGGALTASALGLVRLPETLKLTQWSLWMLTPELQWLFGLSAATAPFVGIGGFVVTALIAARATIGLRRLAKIRRMLPAPSR